MSVTSERFSTEFDLSLTFSEVIDSFGKKNQVHYLQFIFTDLADTDEQHAKVSTVGDPSIFNLFRKIKCKGIISV